MTTTQAELEFDERLRQDPAGAYASFETLHRLLAERRVLFGGEPLPCCVKPHFVLRDRYAAWIGSIEALLRAAEELGRILLAEPDLYEEIGLPPAARALISIDPGYRRLAIVARPDVLWNGERLAVCEINCDSPAMMTFTDVIEEQILSLSPLAEVAVRYEMAASQRTRALLDAALEAYREWGGREPAPAIAIVDWRGQKTEQEREYAARWLTRLGYPATACDPRELKIQGRRLLARGRPVDVVLRRVLFPDFLARADELGPLLTAYRERLACVVNPLRSFLIGNKSLLALLGRPEVLSRLSPQARSACRSTLLPTFRLRPGDEVREEFVARRADWVLKPALGYGGERVEFGAAHDARSWQAVMKSAAGPWVLQQRFEPQTCRSPLFEGRPGEMAWTARRANWCPFVFGGRFGGAMTRVSRQMIVSITARGALLPAIPVRH